MATNEDIDKIKEALSSIKSENVTSGADDTIFIKTDDINDSVVSSTLDYSISASSLNWNSINTGVYGTTGATSGMYYASNNNGNSIWTNSTSGVLSVDGDAEFNGDIKWQGRSLIKLLETIESRLAIIEDPSPEKLEKFEALRKAYEHYKTIERLIGED
jgi:hypothetical protein